MRGEGEVVWDLITSQFPRKNFVRIAGGPVSNHSDIAFKASGKYPGPITPALWSEGAFDRL